MNELIETRQATIERTADNVLEVRYKPGQTLDPAGIGDVLHERERLCGGQEGQAVLAVIPPDALPYRIEPMRIVTNVASLLFASVIGCAFVLRRVLKIDPASAIGNGT